MCMETAGAQFHLDIPSYIIILLLTCLRSIKIGYLKLGTN
jgi:hypothetical protein